jgi:hypothetical protein
MRRYVSLMRIGLISDTHLPSLVHQLDELGPEIGEFLATVELILHGGDVIAPAVLDWCAQFAPVLVSRGNNDRFHDPRMADVQMLDVEGWRIGMAHELRPESRPIAVLIDSALGGEKVDILIGGDTHVERLEYRDNVVLVNSGSPILPHHKEARLGTLGLLEVERGRLRAEIVRVGETPGLANPGVAQHMVLVDGEVVEAWKDGELWLVS